MWTTITNNLTAALRTAAFLAMLGVTLLLVPHAHADTSGLLLPLTDMPRVEEGRADTWQIAQRGDVLPLETVLGIARREIGGGQLLEVDLNNRTGVYRLKMLRPNDSVVDVIVDGKTGRVLRVRGQ